ncbi:MAG: hypothetical protein R3C53_12200 [Pirellulaceae bacterium]
MLKLLQRGAWVGAICGSCFASASFSSAGENGHPALNALGRFWGYGYSHQGYQTAPGRLNIVRQMHPAADYPSTRLLAPYHAAVYPNVSNQNGYGYPQPLAMPMLLPGTTESSGSQGTAPVESLRPRVPKIPTPQKTVPEKPVGPPPTWLEPFLKDQEAPPPGLETIQTPPGTEISTEPDAEVEISPSDRTEDDLLLLDSATFNLQAPAGRSSFAPRYNRYR